MIPLFKKRKKQEEMLNNGLEKVAQGIVTTCLRWQSKWASWMQSKTENLSINSKLILLSLFIGLTGSYSIYLITNSFLTKKKSTIMINPNKKSWHIPPSDVDLLHDTSISEEEYQQIHRFRLYMDSLENKSYAKNPFDSIIATRPGLMDSILIIENMYQSQSKK